MEFADKKILVVGAGISGVAATKLLMDEKADVILFDAKDTLLKSEILSQLPGFTGEIMIGKELPEEVYQELDFVIVSPGVPMDIPMILKMKELQIPVMGEIELAYKFAKGKLAAVTGTNGKTTTTALTGEIMKTYFKDVFVVGNIGLPYTEYVKNTNDESVTVAEMSSFQLETILEFRPNVSMILNITPDHLNRHHTMDAYIDAKMNITKNQTAEDTCILNYDDPALRERGKELACNVIWFSSSTVLSEGLYYEDEQIKYAKDGEIIIVCNVDEMKIFGKHSYENAMAAIGAAITFHVPMESIHKALTTFKAFEHRIEYVTTKNGVAYYNDSKGTNPDASIKAVQAMKTRTLLIGGGYDKGSDYDEWIQAFEGKIKYLVLMGQTREKIEKAAHKNGFYDTVMVESMEEAVEFCKKNAEEGESVLLSPCCASWGMFKNYEERGQIFKDLVNAIQ